MFNQPSFRKKPKKGLTELLRISETDGKARSQADGEDCIFIVYSCNVV